MISLEQNSLPASNDGRVRRSSNGGGGSGSIERARRYLRQTCEPLGFIAGKSGFGSLEQFQAQFLERTGESPSRYRKRILGGEMNWLPGEGEWVERAPLDIHGFGSPTDEPTAIFG